MKKIEKFIFISLFIVLMPFLPFIGITQFEDRRYLIIAFIIVIAAFVPFWLRANRKGLNARELSLIAVMTALSVAGRTLFYLIPGFKPVAALAAIAGMALGAEAGFLTGALSALLSNMIFGQGPWTPFQMFAWGMIGFFASFLTVKKRQPSKVALILYGTIAGIFFSFAMDIWGTVSAVGIFSKEAFIVAITSAIPFTIIYIVSNIVFLLLLTNPIMQRLNRIKTKYKLFQ